MSPLSSAMILAALALAYLPRSLVPFLIVRDFGRYDNAHPRAQQAELKGLAFRAQSAHLNGLEAFAPFAAGVLACEIAHVSAERIALLSVGFVIVRLLYVVFYLANLSTARSAVWGLGLALTCALLAQPLVG